MTADPATAGLRAEDLAWALRSAVQVGPFGPNARAVMEQGGKVSLTPDEARDIAQVALGWLDDHPAETAGERETDGLSEAVEAVRLLHLRVSIQPTDCTDENHTHDAGDNGIECCWDCPPEGYWCAECHEDDGSDVDWPCPTLAAITAALAARAGGDLTTTHTPNHPRTVTR